MAITKILNIQESDGRNPASHLKNALEYIQNPDKTEECVLVGGINCLPDTAFEQMEETKNIFHKTGKRQGYHVIISFSPEEKVTAEQAMYVLEHFAKDVLGDDYEAVYAVHTDREHMHGHLIWNSVSMTTGKKYNSPKSNWKNHLQPITNKYCDELGLSIMPAEYSRNPKNISRDKWEKEMSMKEIILRDAKGCLYVCGVKFETPIDKMRTSVNAGNNILCPHEPEAPKELDRGNFLVKVVIPARLKNVIMKQLEEKGITKEALLPM